MCVSSPRSKLQPNEDSLLSLVRLQKWDIAAQRLQAHPEEAADLAKGSKNTALHLACVHRAPEELIRQLVEFFPDAICMQNKYGATPLHLACCNWTSEAMIRFFLKASLLCGNKKKEDGSAPMDAVPNVASIPNMYGHTPLFAACRQSAPEGILRALLEQDPSVVLKQDNAGDNPLMAFCHHLHGEEESDNSIAFEEKVEFKPTEDFIAKAMLLLKAANLGTVESGSNQDFKPLHAALLLGKKCPLEIVQLMITLFPEQAEEMNAAGQYPLSMAISNGGLGWNEGVEKLFLAAPHALGKRNPTTRLYPFMEAAVSLSDSLSGLDTVFELLCAEPELVWAS